MDLFSFFALLLAEMKTLGSVTNESGLSTAILPIQVRLYPAREPNRLEKQKKPALPREASGKNRDLNPSKPVTGKRLTGGNLCRDNDECEGWCQVDLSRDELSQGMRRELKTGKKTGQCSVWVVELGCFGMMKKGNAQVICID